MKDIFVVKFTSVFDIMKKVHEFCLNVVHRFS